MKDYLTRLIEAKQQRAQELRKLIGEAQTADEVRSLGNELTTVEQEERDAQLQLDALNEAEENRGAGSPLYGNGFDPTAMIATAQMNNRSTNDDPYATIE